MKSYSLNKVVIKNRQKFVIVVLIFVMVILLSFSCKYFGSVLARAKVAVEGPIINDTHLTAQLIVSGLKTPVLWHFLAQTIF